MPTVFIAVQCCECCTIQVKQKKKSSNKWICVVCNQKQSVRKVFAQGSMAKDVRKFVQNFNLSRQFSDQQLDLVDDGEPQTLGAEDALHSNRNSKRTDWTDYLDYEDESVEKEDEQSTGNGLETRIVTELPKAVFKRPKLSNYPAGSESNGNKRFQPVFMKRNTRKQSTFQDNDKGLMAKGTPEWEDCTIVSQDIQSRPKIGAAKAKGNKVNEEPRHRNLLTTAKGNSKWSEYLTTDRDDDNLELGSLRRVTGGNDKCQNIALENPLKDHNVDEEIHPDFM